MPNPAATSPDGEADIGEDGLMTSTADFSEKGQIYDIIIAEGGVVGEFDEVGFDSGGNDGAIVTGLTPIFPEQTGEGEGGVPICGEYDCDTPIGYTENRVQVFKGFLEYLPDRVRIISIPSFAKFGMNDNQTNFGAYLDTLTGYGLNRDGLHEALAHLGIAQMEDQMNGTSNYKDIINRLTPEFYNPYNEVAISLVDGIVNQGANRALQARQGTRTALMVDGYGQGSSAGAGAEKKASFWIGGTWDTNPEGSFLLTASTSCRVHAVAINHQRSTCFVASLQRTVCTLLNQAISQ